MTKTSMSDFKKIAMVGDQTLLRALGLCLRHTSWGDPIRLTGRSNPRNWLTSCFSRPEVMLCVDGTLKSRNWLTSCFMSRSEVTLYGWRDAKIQEMTYFLLYDWVVLRRRNALTGRSNPRTDSPPASVVLRWRNELTGRSNPRTDSPPASVVLRWPNALTGRSAETKNWLTSRFRRPGVTVCVDGTFRSRNWLTPRFKLSPFSQSQRRADEFAEMLNLWFMQLSKTSPALRS